MCQRRAMWRALGHFLAANQQRVAGRRPVLFALLAAGMLFAAAGPACVAQEAPRKPATPKAEPRLVFNFRFQKWADVLEWFAQQCDMSLVLDAPPPGTFNYSDTRTYTPSEAIDLLNGVLDTKDFTLVRRGRMLMAIDLKNGVPNELIPRIEIKELDERGKFEMVRVMFPLGASGATEVEAEIKPLLSRYGKSLALPMTKQILVTDHAGIMRAVAAVINSMPSPPAPLNSKGGETPVIGVYPLKGADGEAAVATLKALVPTATFVFDPKSQQINAFATPTQQAAVKVVVGQLQADTPAENRARLELYPFDPATAESAVQNLAVAVPKAHVRFDSASGRLVAWGTPSEQQEIKAMLAKLMEAAPSLARQVKIYHLDRSDPSAAVSLLQSLLPNARLSVDASTRSVVALATPAEHATIKTSLDRLESQRSETAAKSTLKIYPVTQLQGQRFQALSSHVLAEFPGVRVIPDIKHGELAIWAAPEEHHILAEVLDKLKADVPADQKLELTVYPITTADPPVIFALMQQMFPGRHIVLEAKSRRLLVWARPDEQSAIRSALLKLDGASSAGTRERMMLFPFSDADPQVAVATIQQRYPDVRLTSDAVSKSIVAWGTTSDLEEVAKMVRQLQAKKPVSQVYRLRSADPNAALTVLQAVVPLARMSVDARNRSLVVSAFPEDHLRIQSAVEQMDQAGDGEHALSLKSYPLSSAEAANIVLMLQTLYAAFPEVRISADSKTQSVVALATAAQHETIKKSIDEMDKQSAARVLRVYRFRSADPNAAAVVLSTLAPKAQVAVDNASRSLVVSALETDHEKIRKMVDEIDRGGTGGGARELRTYPLASADPPNVLSMLQTLFASNPDVRLSIDDRTETLVALARPEEQATIKKSVEEMEAKAAGRTTQTYALDHAQADSAVTVLATLAPRARVAVDHRTNSIVVNASHGDQARIKAAVAQMDIPSKPREFATVKAYQLKSANPSSVMGTVQALFASDPDVRLSVDAASNSLVVLANKDQHAKIEQLVSQVDGEAGRRRFELEVFNLEAVDPFTAELAIEKLFSHTATPNVPSPSVESNQEAQQLIVRGTKEQLAEIRKLLTRMGEPAAASGAASDTGRKRIRVIRFNGDADSAIREIERVWPRLRGNELHVVVPSAVAPTLRRSVSPPDKPHDDPPIVPERDAPAPKNGSGGQGQFSVLDELPAAGPKSEKKPKENPIAPQSEKRPVSKPTPAAGPGTKPTVQKQPSEKKPPVIISHSGGTITIASDDPQALDELESLLRTMSTRVGGRGSDFIVFTLQHAAADSVAGLLQQLFRNNASGFGAFGAGRMAAVADDRLNAVVVRAGRGERRDIEQLLQVLDAPEVSDVLVRNKPHIIPLKNTRSDRILEVLRGVYQKQLTATGGRRAISVPAGVSVDVVAAIQQVNASTQGPLLTLEADDGSNSIIAMGPASLVGEIEKLIGDLDSASVKDVSHTLRLVPLESMNARKLRDVLDRMLERQRQNQPGRRGGR